MPRFAYRKLIPLVALLVLVLASAASAQDWKGRGRARGSVKDADGKGIAGATITLFYKGQKGAGPTLTSDKKGNWGYIGLITGDFTVVVEAPGYVPIEAQIRINEYDAAATKPLDVVLRTAEATIGGGGSGAEAEANRLMGVLNAGNEKLKNKEYAAARAAYQEVLAEVKDPKQQMQLKAAIGDTYLGENKGAEARAIFEELVPQTEDPAVKATYHQRIARGYYLENKIDESVKTLEEALATNPQDTVSLRLIIDILVSSGREAQAEPYMARLPKGEKVDPNALLNLGIAAYNAGDMDAALEKFQRVLADYPENPDAWYYLGLSELAKGRNPEAKAALEKFLALAPDHRYAADAKQFLSYLK